VQIRLRVFGEVKVDHHIDRLDVDATREEVCAATMRASAMPCRLHPNSITMQSNHVLLQHILAKLWKHGAS
jgi:hypothetical protein